VVERAERIQQLERLNDGVRWRLVEEIEIEDIVDPQGLEHEDDHGEVGPLNLGDRVLQQLVPESPFRV
jgi:hypothetical protein